MSGTNTKKKDELYAPEMPGQIDNTAVQGANQKYTAAMDALDAMNYDSFKQGSMYAGLQKSYAQQGQQAMKDTLGQVAARTGGMASSYATTAAQQSYNNYMHQLEDVARSMYNDEYSRARDKVTLAQGDYDRAYGEYRDKVTDEWTKYKAAWDKYEYGDKQYREDLKKEEERIASDAYYGKASDYATYKANGGTLDEQTYNSIVAAAQGKYKDDNKSNRDTEMKALLGSEDFNWDNHDWNGDAPGLGTPADFFSGSTYGEDYWRRIYDDAQAGYAAETHADNLSDIQARIANGQSLDAIAQAYGITNDDNGWKSVSDITAAEINAYYNQATAPTSLDPELMEKIYSNAATYAETGEEALRSYLRLMMDSGLPEGHANNILQVYFPSVAPENVPFVYKNTGGKGGGRMGTLLGGDAHTRK